MNKNLKTLVLIFGASALTFLLWKAYRKKKQSTAATSDAGDTSTINFLRSKTGDNRKSPKYVQVVNDTQSSSAVTGITVDDDPLVFDSGTGFPVTNSTFGVFKTAKSVNGLKTIRVTVTGGTQIDIVDSDLNLFSIPVSGAGTYAMAGVYFSEPNANTQGVGISLL